jgi:predicted TIM-barrel fold metal-dependent hydrolase
MRLKEEFYQNGKFSDCPIYDLHGHMGSFYGAHFPRNSPEQMVKIMEKFGVKLLVFCHHFTLFSPDIGNSVNIESVKKFPDKFRAYCGINPHYPENIKKDLEDFEQNKDIFVGFKFLADYHRVPITDERYKPAWEFADKKNLLVLMHTWGGSPSDGPQQVRKCAEKYKNVKILMGHSCHGEWDKAIKLSQDFPNVYLDLCAVPDEERGIIEKFVMEAGSEKIIFGTDFPWFNYAYYIGTVLGAEISEEDRKNIFFKNAQRLLKKI